MRLEDRIQTVLANTNAQVIANQRRIEELHRQIMSPILNVMDLRHQDFTKNWSDPIHMPFH
jgi:hypothetical protein